MWVVTDGYGQKENKNNEWFSPKRFVLWILIIMRFFCSSSRFRGCWMNIFNSHHVHHVYSAYSSPCVVYLHCWDISNLTGPKKTGPKCKKTDIVFNWILVLGCNRRHFRQRYSCIGSITFLLTNLGNEIEVSCRLRTLRPIRGGCVS